MSQYKHLHLAHPKYRPDIDGLRAIAILAVVAFHFFPGKMPGGFIGVDIFFVISGFLISTIIFSSLERDRFSLVEFYVRRTRRIFPALILVLISCLTFGWLLLLADEYKQLGKHTAAGAGFIQNFILWCESGYFDNSAETKPLLHLWSLAIEEQFYIFWPLLLTFVWNRHWSFLRIAASIAAVSFVANIYLVLSGHQTAAFYLPFSRFWELMIGCVLAYVVLHMPKLIEGHKNLQSFFGFALLVVGFILLNEDRDFPGWWALLPTVGAFFIISAGPTSWLNEKLLANKPMVWIGLISYPLYLWHWPILSFVNIYLTAPPTREIKLLIFILSVLMAWITYQFVERTIRFGTFKKNITILSLVLMGLSLIAGLIVSKGFIIARNSNPHLSTILSAKNDWSYPEGLQKRVFQGEEYYFIEGDIGSKTLFLGDSHIEQYSPRVISVLNVNKRANSVYFWSLGACPHIPYVDYPNKICQARLDSAIKFIKLNKINQLVIGACWNCYFNDYSYHFRETPNRDNLSFVKNGKFESFRNTDGRNFAFYELEKFLKKYALEINVTLILDNPISQEQDPESFFSGNRIKGLSVNVPSQMTDISADQFLLREKLLMIAKKSGVRVIDPMNHLCDIPNNSCLRVLNDGRPIYKDSNHLRPFFVRDLAYLDHVLLP